MKGCVNQWDWKICMILINGCSHTHGTEWLLKNKQKNWPTLFSELSGLEVTNIAMAGSSWHSISYTTVEWLEKNDKPDAVICAFPEIWRLSFPSSERHNYETSFGNIVNNSFREYSKDLSIFPTGDNLLKQPKGVFNDYWKSSPHNYIWHIEQMLHSVNYLINVCENKNIPLHLVFWSEKNENLLKKLKVTNFDFHQAVTKYYDFEDYAKQVDEKKDELISLFDQYELIERIDKYDMFPNRKIAIRFSSVLNGHIGIGDTGKGFYDTHHDEVGHMYFAKRIYEKYCKGIDCDFELDDVEALKKAIENKPEFKETVFYDDVKLFIDHGVKHGYLQYDEFFVYD